MPSELVASTIEFCHREVGDFAPDGPEAGLDDVDFALRVVFSPPGEECLFELDGIGANRFVSKTLAGKREAGDTATDGLQKRSAIQRVR